jgi:hypothetical protein
VARLVFKAAHPQTCGKVERFHQTLKRRLAKQEPSSTIEQLQALLDQFREYYNQVRPHRAIGRRTPAQAFSARAKAVPSGPKISGHYRVRNDRVDETGVITLRHNSRLHHIGLGRAHKRKRVLVLVSDLNVRVLDEEGDLIRALELDPSHDYQRQGG